MLVHSVLNVRWLKLIVNLKILIWIDLFIQCHLSLIILYFKSFVSMSLVFDFHDLNSLFLFVWLEMVVIECFVRNYNSSWLKPIVNYGSIILQLFQPLFWWYLKDVGCQCQCTALIDYLEAVVVNNSLLSSHVSFFKKIVKSPSQVYFGELKDLIYLSLCTIKYNCTITVYIDWCKIRVVWLRQ